MSGPKFSLSLSIDIMDSMLLRILGGEEGDALGSLFGSISRRVALDKIEDDVVAKKVQFIAHKPRGKNGTQICTSLDGNVYPADSPDIPAIPQHFSCRSQYRYIDGVISGR